MSVEKMREEFEVAYVDGLVRRCGEGFRSTALYSLTEKRPDGDYKNYTDFIAWWAWRASRELVVIELPVPETPEDYEIFEKEEPEEYARLECRAGAQYDAIFKCKKAIEAAGVKCK